MAQHFARMVVYSPYFDSKTSWYTNSWVYLDAYAIYVNPSNGSPDVAGQHPEWILKDSSNKPLYIPWGCESSNRSCPQYAADFSNPAYQQWWIGVAKQTLGKGTYRGLWIDDVNMDFRVSDGHGDFKTPIDPNTGSPMSEDNWRRYFTEFLENVRTQLPGVEIVHNSIWYAGGPARDANPYVGRQIAAADRINIESGVNDRNLMGGDGAWSLRALLGYVDRLHRRGRRVVIDNLAGGNADDATARLYTIANYFLISNGTDAVGDGKMVITPENWWPGFSVELGSALGERRNWNGLIRRDFALGMVLVNAPDSATVVATLPKTHRALNGRKITSITLAAREGAVLLKGLK